MKYRAAVITVSDSCFVGDREDHSGPALANALQSIGIDVTCTKMVPDEETIIEQTIRDHLTADVHLIVTTGGTGFSPRDVTPEATARVIEKPAPGIAELLRQAGADQTPLTWLSRGSAGIVSGKLIINLPGNPKAMSSSVATLKPVIFHALDLLNGAKPH